MLRAFGWLVSNIVSMLATIFNRPTRDWHTGGAREDQLPTPNDPTPKEARHSQPSFPGKRKAPIPKIPVASTQGTTPNSHATQNQDARHKAEHNSLDDLEAELQLRVPRVGGDPDSAQRADTQPECASRTDWTPAFAGDTACDTHARSLPAHTDKRRYPGQNANLVPPCSFKPAHAAHPFPDSDTAS
jgi:hypothetical protein